MQPQLREEEKKGKFDNLYGIKNRVETIMRPKLLDLFCGAGGASVGYHRAGFEVVGVDIKPQPRYQFDFIKHDALTFPIGEMSKFDVIHASPPCQKYTHVNSYQRDRGKEYPDLIGATREILIKTKKLYVIENVPQAPLTNQIKLCGSMFGLDVRRHRFFECQIIILAPECNHKRQKPRFKALDWKRQKKGALSRVVGVHGSTQYSGDFELRCKAMGIDWMKNSELTQAIPPEYTKFIGKRLITHLKK
jgi:DNA (cytosine-5)-methyltransferase 1